MFIYEMKDGFEWATIVDNQTAFDAALGKLVQDIRDNNGHRFDRLDMFSQILERKKVVWMEGSLGWTTWIENMDDVLHQSVLLFFLDDPSCCYIL